MHNPAQHVVSRQNITTENQIPSFNTNGKASTFHSKIMIPTAANERCYQKVRFPAPVEQSKHRGDSEESRLATKPSLQPNQATSQGDKQPTTDGLPTKHPSKQPAQLQRKQSDNPAARQAANKSRSKHRSQSNRGASASSSDQRARWREEAS